MPSNDLDEHELYLLVRRAIRDAIWDVIEAILTVFITVVLLSVGAGFTARGLQSLAGIEGWLTIVFGFVVMAGGVVYFLRKFDLLPFT